MGRMAKDDPRRPENRLIPDEYFDPNYWYVAVTKLSSEFVVQRRFEESGLESYLPLMKPRRRPRRGQKRIRPLFSRYIFVRLADSHAFYRATWTPGVHAFVTMNLRPVAVSNAVIEEIVAREEKEGFVHEPELLFSPGQNVRVAEGLFEGLQGFFQSASRRPGMARVILQQGKDGVSALVEIEQEYLSNVT